jgi:hypothetical protein
MQACTDILANAMLLEPFFCFGEGFGGLVNVCIWIFNELISKEER